MTGSVLRHRWFVMAIIFLARTTMAMQFLILAKMTAEWFAGKEISTAMSIMLTSWPFGIGLGAALFGAIGAASSWRLVQHLAAALAAGAFVLVALLGRDAPDVGATGAPLRFLPNLSPRGWALALTAGAAWMLFNVGFIVMVGFGPGLLQARGATLGHAGYLVSLAIWVSSISVPLGGAVVDRTRRPNLAIVLGCVLTAGAIVAMPLIGSPVAWLLLSGVVMNGGPVGFIVLNQIGHSRGFQFDRVRPSMLSSAPWFGTNV